MELQAESERIKRSKILSSEGEMISKINIAEGIKREAILNGEGEAAKISQEALSLCEALGSISMASQGDGGNNALRMRLSEQYMDALQDILVRANVVMVPDDHGSSDNLTSAKNIAQVMTMYKSIIGGGGDPKAVQEMASLGGNNELSSLLNKIINDVDGLKQQQGSNKGGSDRFKYLDDRSLYSTD
jgi:hypothetical protein